MSWSKWLGFFIFLVNPTGGSFVSLYIGSDYPSARNTINGTIDEFGVYDRALTADEIKEHYGSNK